MSGFPCILILFTFSYCSLYPSVLSFLVGLTAALDPSTLVETLPLELTLQCIFEPSCPASGIRSSDAAIRRNGELDRLASTAIPQRAYSPGWCLCADY